MKLCSMLWASLDGIGAGGLVVLGENGYMFMYG